MRHMLLVATLVFGLLIHTSANALMIDFTEVYSSADGPTQTLGGNEWAAYGITTSNSFWYVSSSDPFDTMGIANANAFGNPPTTGEITFLSTLTTLSIDWVTLTSNDIYIDAFDAGGVLIDSFYFVGTGTSFGTTTFSGPISSFQFHDSGGTVGISTLNFTYAAVPEPASLLLLGSGLFGFVAMRKKIIV